MKQTLLYGRDDLDVQVPDDTVVIEPSNIPALENQEEAVLEAMKTPIGTPSLREMVTETDTVAIVISDITRPTPNDILVPAIMRALDHVPLENFVIINGTGTHRDQTKDEFVEMLGEWMVDNIRIVNNHCHEKDELVKVGQSSYGCDRSSHP